MIYGIVCCDQAGGIGKDNSIPWKSKRDLAHFKHITEGSTVLMGRKTWDSLPTKPLPNRTNLVVSSEEGDYLSLEEAKEKLTSNNEDIYIMGGASIYSQLAEYIDYWYITVIGGNYNCDTKINIDLSEFLKVGEITVKDGGYVLSFKEYRRK